MCDVFIFKGAEIVLNIRDHRFKLLIYKHTTFFNFNLVSKAIVGKRLQYLKSQRESYKTKRVFHSGKWCQQVNEANTESILLLANKRSSRSWPYLGPLCSFPPWLCYSLPFDSDTILIHPSIRYIVVINYVSGSLVTSTCSGTRK